MNVKKVIKIQYVLPAVLLAVAIGMHFFSKHNTSRFEKIVVRQTEQHLQTISKTQSGFLEECISHIKVGLAVVAGDRLVQRMTAENILNESNSDDFFAKYPLEKNIYDSFVKSGISVDEIYRIDSNGIVQSRIPFKENKVGVDYTHKARVKYVIENQKPYISDVMTSGSGIQSISICEPIFYDGQFAGMIRAVIRLDYIASIIDQVSIGQNGVAWIVDGSGNFIACSQSNSCPKQPVGDKEDTLDNCSACKEQVVQLIKTAESGNSILGQNGSEDDKLLVVWHSVHLGEKTWTVGVSLAYDEISGPIKVHARIIFICLAAILSIFAICVASLYKASDVKLKLKAKELSTIDLKENNLQLAEEVTRRMKVQKELQYSERRLKTILNTVETGIVIIDCQKHEILEVNSSAAEMIGTRKDEIVGKSCHGFICPYESGDCPISDHGQVVHECEQSLMTANGQEVPVLKTITMVKLNGRNCLLESLVDITDQKAIQEQLEKAKESAEASAKVKSQFLANMSHEIRTPMNAIIGFGGLLGDEKLTGDQSDYVNMICRSSEDLLVIINDILDFSKIEAGKMEIEMTACNLKELMDDMKSLMANLAAEKGLEYEIFMGEDVPAVILTDTTRIRQCLINVINNAIKFTRSGHVHVNIGMHGSREEAFVRFDVEDTGIGIDHKRQAVIFDSFTQADGGTCREFGGTGLGLTITKQLTKLLGGDISVASNPGEGSTFTVKIPARISEQSEESENDLDNTDIHDLGIRTQRAAMKALIAEDCETDQTLIKILLERQGFKVTVVEDGSDAVAITGKEDFDIIFMDLHMPGVNGYKATQKIRAAGVEVPIIAITADLYGTDAEKCIAIGCDDYITKPIDMETLYEILVKHFASKSAS